MQIINKTILQARRKLQANDSPENAATPNNININYVMLLARI